jgi:hypothetical protein
MRRLRCLLGGHEWVSEVPDGVTLRYDEHRVVCGRCGACVTTDAHNVSRPHRRRSLLDDGLRHDPDKPWSWGS